MSLACPAFFATAAPTLCRSVDIYCERTGAALDAEPLNAFTNLAFLVAAFAAWRLTGRRGASGIDVALIVVTAVIGIGSFLFHTLATAWAGVADVAPIMLFMLVYLWLALRRFLGLRVPATLAGLALFIAAGALLGALPQDLFPGASYLPALAAMVIVGLMLKTRDPLTSRRLIAAGAVFAASYFFRSIDRPFCEAMPLGTHFLWHLLNATVLLLLMRAAILQPSARTREGA